MAFSYVWMLWGRLRDLSTPSVQPWGSMGGDLVDPMICAGREVVGTAALQVCSLGAYQWGTGRTLLVCAGGGGDVPATLQICILEGLSEGVLETQLSILAGEGSHRRYPGLQPCWPMGGDSGRPYILCWLGRGRASGTARVQSADLSVPLWVCAGGGEVRPLALQGYSLGGSLGGVHGRLYGLCWWGWGRYSGALGRQPCRHTRGGLGRPYCLCWQGRGRTSATLGVLPWSLPDGPGEPLWSVLVGERLAQRHNRAAA